MAGLFLYLEEPFLYLPFELGKLAIVASVVLLLSGCAGQPATPPTPTPSVSLDVKAQTGDPEADKLIAMIHASCEYGRTHGLISQVTEENSLCTESVYADGVVAIGSAQNDDGVVFEYVLKKINANTYDWAVYRGSPDRTFNRITCANGLITSIKWHGGYSYKFTYGPLDPKLETTRQDLQAISRTLSE